MIEVPPVFMSRTQEPETSPTTYQSVIAQANGKAAMYRIEPVEGTPAPTAPMEIEKDVYIVCSYRTESPTAEPAASPVNFCVPLIAMSPTIVPPASGSITPMTCSYLRESPFPLPAASPVNLYEPPIATLPDIVPPARGR
jgi:hypothetical protein